MRILIADDDSIARDLLEHLLRSEGYEVDACGDGASALAEFRRHHHRLIISDWDMPVMSGLDFCRAVRRNDFDGYTYFILLTSHSRTQDKVEGMNAGADDFVGKPFDPAELIVRIRAGQRILGLETRDVAIFALARLAESRDPETGAHLERVQRYCGLLARTLRDRGEFLDEIDDEFIRLLHLTSPLHDIGKVGIPDAVLLKPGRLTTEEFEIMKKHAELGANTLQAALDKFPDAGFLRMARDIALTHHERYNGTGYPRGLRGTDIPLSGRITALADVYDALSTRRIYKPAYAHDVVVDMISAETGKHFDPIIVDAFLFAAYEFRIIREELADEQVEERALMEVH